MQCFQNMAATALARHFAPVLRLIRFAVLLIIAAVSVCATRVASVYAAEIKVGVQQRDEMVLEGNIEAGDYSKILNHIRENYPRSIYLASPGGNVAEAIKIGRLIRALNLETAIPAQNAIEFRSRSIALLKKIADGRHIKQFDANYVCASACFFIFVSGVHRSKDPILMEEPKLGIHRPFFTDTDLRALSANAAIASAKGLRTLVESYLKEMNVPDKYADMMFSVSKDQIRWISIADFESDLEGFIPPLKDWIDARCDKRTDAEKAMWEAFKDKRSAEMTAAEKSVSDLLMKKLSEQYRCEYAALREINLQAYLKMFPEPK